MARCGRLQVLQVHGQEGDVVQPVDEAEMFVELQAVQDAGSVGEAEDVVAQQVAVSVDDAAPPDAVVEQRLAAVEELVDEVLDLEGVGGVQHCSVEGAELVEGGLPAAAQGVSPRLFVDLGVRGGRGCGSRPSSARVGRSHRSSGAVAQEAATVGCARACAASPRVVAGTAVGVRGVRRPRGTRRARAAG